MSRYSTQLGGVSADVTYAGPLLPYNGVEQFNIARSLTGSGNVELLLKTWNPVVEPVSATIK